MKTIRLVALALMAALGAFSTAAEDLRAITQDGRTVILKQDGRWVFDPINRSIGRNQTQDPLTPVKSFSFKYNPQDWLLRPRQNIDPPNKRQLSHKVLPVAAMVISDEIPASLAAMRDLILQNAGQSSSSYLVLLDETKNVGKHEIGNMRIAATVDKIDFIFSFNYYANSKGNIQIVCYTAQALYFKHQAECQKFLDEFHIVDNL